MFKNHSDLLFNLSVLQYHLKAPVTECILITVAQFQTLVTINMHWKHSPRFVLQHICSADIIWMDPWEFKLAEFQAPVIYEFIH